MKRCLVAAGGGNNQANGHGLAKWLIHCFVGTGIIAKNRIDPNNCGCSVHLNFGNTECSMYYGLQFNSSMGEALQVVINTAGLQMYARATSGGVFGEWAFICGATEGVPGGGSGGSFAEADKAKVAEEAYRLSVPMQINFTGDVLGDVRFDGSQNTSCNLAVRDFDARIREMVNAVVRDSIINQNGELLQVIRKETNEAISEHERILHNSEDIGSGGGNQ